MGELRILALQGPLGPQELRLLWRLLRRHGSRVLAVALVVELDPGQAGGLAKGYGLRPLRLPASLLLEDGG